jgi:Na+/H+ antiporter NhaC
MGLLYFIDDYSDIMIVGSAMRPVTDRFRVSREKLAFLVDATSAPVAGLAIVSSWIAFEAGLFGVESQKLGLGLNGYSMFLDALRFRFYCILMLIFVFMHILVGRDFGPMEAAELRAQREGPPDDADRLGDDESEYQPTDRYEPPSRAIVALIPLGGLLTFHIAGLWWNGGGLALLREGHALLSWTYWREVISQANSLVILDLAALFSLALAFVCARLFAALPFRIVGRCLRLAVKRSALPFFILILAWSLKNSCDNLGTDEFLGAILAGKLSPAWYPALVFLVACLTSFATGTSWGAMSILIPTAVPIAYSLDGNSYGPTTMITLGAVLDGSIFGDHCSPISDTTIMSSVSSSCDLIQHVRTQLPYSLLVASLAIVCGYIPCARGVPWGWSFSGALLLMIGFFLILMRRKKGMTAAQHSESQPGQAHQCRKRGGG